LSKLNNHLTELEKAKKSVEPQFQEWLKKTYGETDGKYKPKCGSHKFGLKAFMAGSLYGVNKIKDICNKHINEPENCPFTECSTALCSGCIFMDSPLNWDTDIIQGGLSD